MYVYQAGRGEGTEVVRVLRTWDRAERWWLMNGKSQLEVSPKSDCGKRRLEGCCRICVWILDSARCAEQTGRSSW